LSGAATLATAEDAEAGAPLPRRPGPRPRTSAHNPHSQLDQFPQRPLGRPLLERGASWAGVVLGPSRRAPPGTVGLHLRPGEGGGGADAFLLEREFAHVHPSADGSLHAILPQPLRDEAVAAGWAELHPMAGMPTVSPDTVMLYGPRDAAELAVVLRLVRASWRNARGGWS